MTLQQNRSDERLHAVLRSLAQGSQTGASAETGDALVDAFRRHHARRRARRRAAVVAALLAFSLPAAWLLRLNHRPETNSQGSHMATKLPSQPVAGSTPLVAGKPVPRRTRTATRYSPKKTPAPLEFVALPAYASTTGTEDARIIRLELSGRALRMVGAPVNPEDEGQQVLADFVVGQDGTPYAVRLVH